MVANWWHRLFARKLVTEIARLEDELYSQKYDNLTRLYEQRGLESKLDALSKTLLEQKASLSLSIKKEVAYAIFLEDNIEGLNHGTVFAALPTEQRELYFRRAEERLNPPPQFVAISGVLPSAKALTLPFWSGVL